ncbi:hypothetical protein [Pseudomonas sp. UBA6310]|uniref:hypothetical protein n=1 Tax=Pseudomonas sp. UBA6310 TaxID=1947327 RepID=UPI00257ADD41|nr:hypothetical protein [Pseudomonas sp. UBA6310]
MAAFDLNRWRRALLLLVLIGAATQGSARPLDIDTAVLRPPEVAALILPDWQALAPVHYARL